MADYAIGDVQGCFDELLALLDRIAFKPERDRLWFAGDLVNRGPKSLEVLRFVKDLGDGAVTVLGNHDLHLLAVASGIHRPKSRDTLGPILKAKDREELVAWLRHQPVLHRDCALGFTLVHAGLSPQWDVDLAEACARELEGALRGPDHLHFFEHMYGDGPRIWSADLKGSKRLRYITNALTRIRFCRLDGRLVMDEKGTPESADRHLLPWFAVPERKSRGEHIVFGHWATLRLADEPDPSHHVYHLDTGCVWGGQLTALNLDTRTYLSVPCPSGGHK